MDSNKQYSPCNGITTHNGEQALTSRESRPVLRMMTYLTPVSLFQTYQHFFEQLLACDALLCVESRWSAPYADKLNPFTQDLTDVGFFCSTGYVPMQGNPCVSLLPVAPVFEHEKGQGRPVYFSEVIVRNDAKTIYKEFEDLRGHRFAMNDDISLSGYISVLAELKKMGTDMSFFSDVVKSGAHCVSVNMVLDGRVDAAAIDSNVFAKWRRDNKDRSERIRVLTSLGPLPIQPILVNSRMPDATREKLLTALLQVDQHPTFAARFREFGITHFTSITADQYQVTRDILDATQCLTKPPTYY